MLAALCALGIDRTGGITLEADRHHAVRRGRRAPRRPRPATRPTPSSGTSSWPARARSPGSRVSFLAFLTIACLLAAIGAITDSPVTVVGAMVLGPEFGPLAAVAVGLVLRRGDLVRRGAFALAVGFPLAMAVTALGALAARRHRAAVHRTARPTSTRSTSSTRSGPFSLIVALLAGAAGMLALTSAKSASLVGVFISVTTVPAAAFASVALVEGRYAQAVQSALQLAVNLVGIVVAAAVVLCSPAPVAAGPAKLSAG